MKNVRVIAIIAVVLSAIASSSSQETAQLRIKSTVITDDLNVKAVPKLELRIEPEAGSAILLSTGLDGFAVIDLPVANYRIKSTKGVDFESKHFDWDLGIKLRAGDNRLELSSDNAKITISLKPRATDDLSTQYKRLQNSVVTVWSEFGHGTGFIIDKSGLILTNQHVLGPSNYVAVQFEVFYT